MQIKMIKDLKEEEVVEMTTTMMIAMQEAGINVKFKIVIIMICREMSDLMIGSGVILIRIMMLEVGD